ncbi:thioredoxin family protein [Saccharothrix algeriensis]|uniref:Thioredoxin n=1 Tax=Saccharothrix algeriensis TaxID=173560 RepID=A0A8T8HSA9_9PSEU|nr:thioredoxin family protein [Saccharothrix algeriensis]MBM7812744.1 thioredoxin 1 [Saccharothrix algeriensis]QTR01423.1 thioredoxin family protein [Saccharothrix algeriensis]
MQALTDDTFEQGTREGAVLVEFTASWCPPCRMIEPVLAELDRELGAVRFAQVDTDANPRTTRDLGVRGMPTLQLYRDGELVAQIVGARPKHQLLAWLEPHL